MFDNIEKFYQDNHFKLIEDKSEGSLRPGKSFTKDVENCIKKFKDYFVQSQETYINEERLQTIIGGVDTNTRSQNLRVMREFGFLVELDNATDDGSKFKLTDNFTKFVESGDSPRDYIYLKLSSIAGLEDFTMYLNLLICTLREAYLYGQVMLFPDSDDKFKNTLPEVEMRTSYRQRIYDVYGYSGRDKSVNDDVYSPNLSYMSRAELENLGLLIMTGKKVDNMNNLVLTKEGYELLCKIDANLGTSVEIQQDNPEERNRRQFKYWMSMQVKPEGDSDAGKPYSVDSINTYSNFISGTKIDDVTDRSLFYTTDSDKVLLVMEELEKSDTATSRQRSAVKKYFEFVSTFDNDSYDEIFKHNLYGLHIKNRTDALSDDNPHICIGWSELGDIAGIESKSALDELFDERIPGASAKSRGQQVGQIWRFFNDVQIGDYVIFAESNQFHIGRVESDYYYDDTNRPEQDQDYKYNRKVKWIKKNISRASISPEFHKSLMTAMSIFSINDYKSAVVDLIRGTYKKDENIDAEEEFMELIFNTSINANYERNRIVFGAPGTGKSFGLKEDCEKLMKETSGSYERVTFHPDYSYSQFVGTYKPVMDDSGNIRYDFVPGPFMRVYVDALKSGRTQNPQPHLLLIEEINRAKVAAVFGDVFQLLDRNSDGVSEYEIQASEDIRRYLAKELGGTADNYTKIRIPNNMFIWSTMNSADQGVFPMDTAFKRRWNFEYLGINENEEEIKGIGKVMIAGSDEPVEWNKLRKAINDKMSTSEFKINEDKLMGPFFLSKKAIESDESGMVLDKDKFVDAFKSKVIMYLYEDAVKQGKNRFFDGCDSSKYSSVCDAFDEKGMGIFGPTFKETFYDTQRDDA